MDAEVLLDDVTGASGGDLVHPWLGGREQLRGHVAKRVDRRVQAADRRDGAVALRPALVVLRRLQLVRRAAVADDKPQVRRERHMPDVQRSAVEEDRLSGDAGRRRELVHHPGLDADIAVLGPLAERSPGGRPGPWRAGPSSARADAISSAADDDSPAPWGTVEARTPRNPRIASPASPSAQAVPAT